MADTKNVIAIIPARGGSKGIPQKNLRTLLGEPLIARAIRIARTASPVKQVVVTTDDSEIAAVAQAAGALVVMRPDELSTDIASSESALLHAIGELEKTNQMTEVFAFLQCTAPLTTAEDIESTIKQVTENEADCAFAAIASHFFLWQPNEAGGVRGVNHQASERLMRQQRPPEYLEAGSVYVMKTKGFKQHKHRFFGNIAVQEIERDHWFELDEMADLGVIEALLEKRGSKQGNPSSIKAIAFDFDGVFTDNLVRVDQNGIETVCCSRSDGMGIELLRNASVPMVVISKERNPVVLARCQKLQLDCEGGVDDKVPILKRWVERVGVSLAETAYVGNDVNDLPCLRTVGHPFVVADCHQALTQQGFARLKCSGGRGAVRELADLVLQTRDHSSR